jgi:predicted ATPase
VLLGREAECPRLEALLDAMHRSSGSALLLHGDLGAGKSALLAYVAEHAGDALVLRAAGLEAEAELPFGVLHQLLRPASGFAERLPAAHRQALERAFAF